MKIPHTFVILMSITLIVSLLTYILPSGKYDVIQRGDRIIVDPDSFHNIENKRVNLM